MRTALRSVKLDGITELASTSTIQHKHAGRDLRVRPQSTGVTSNTYRPRPTRTRRSRPKCYRRTRIPLSEDDVFSSVCRAISILPEYKLHHISCTVESSDIKHYSNCQQLILSTWGPTRGQTHSATC